MKSSHYIEYQPVRDISKNRFSQGLINFEWTMDSTGYFKPSSAYIKIRYKLYKRVSSADVSLSLDDGIAPNMFMGDNLFQSQKILLNSHCIESIDDYVPQCSSIIKRLNYNNEELENTSSLDYSDAYVEERQTNIIPDDHKLQENNVSSAQSGTVAIAATGVITLSAANTGLAIGDVLRLADGREFEILLKTDTSTFETQPIKTAIGATSDGTWVYYSRRDREQVLYNNKKENRDKQSFEMIYRLPLNFFQIDEYLPGCQGLYTLQLSPNPSQVLERSAIENSTGANIEPGSSSDANANYVFEIETMNMYMLKGIGEPVINKKIEISLKCVRCQQSDITTNSVHQKTFQIHPNTSEIAMAYQFNGASIENNAFSASKFICNARDDLKLRRLWLQFGSKTLPQPLADPEYNETTKVDFYTERYWQTMMYANRVLSYEPYLKWLNGRGAYYFFSGYGDHEKDDRVYVSQQFDSFGDNSIKPALLLFDFWTKKVVINIEGSRIKDVVSY